jgi:hypothetical protein
MLKRQGQERWLYPGNNQIPAAVIVFKGGEVIFRGREGAEPVNPASDFTFRENSPPRAVAGQLACHALRHKS